MKVLITGGSGFIGTNLVEYYLNQKDTVLNLDIKAPRNVTHNRYWKKIDIRDFQSFGLAINDFAPDTILHMAARADLLGKTLEDYSTNTIGVQNLIQIAKELGYIKRIIFASSMLVCKVGYIPKDFEDYCPPNLYGQSKVIGEGIVRNAKVNFEWVIVRPSSIWGPWFGPTYRKFFEMIIKKLYFNFTGRMSIKTYGYIGNVVYQIDKILNTPYLNKKTFYLGDYVPTNIKEWAIEIASNIDSKVITVPQIIIKALAKMGDVLQRINIVFPMNSFRLENMTTDNSLPLEETKLIAPFLPFTRIQGNSMTIDWMINHYFKHGNVPKALIDYSTKPIAH